MKNQITITRADNGFVLSVDGGSIECGTTAEVMSRVGHEMGMPFNKAQRQLFERMEAAERLADDLVSENNALLRANTDLSHENDTLRKAIVRWFVRAFKEGRGWQG